MTGRRAGRVLLGLASAAVVAGCATTPDGTVAAASQALASPAQSTSSTSTSSAPSSPSPSPSPTCNPATVTTSLPPMRPLPDPQHMPKGSYMATVAKQGYLVVGVDQNTAGLASYDPVLKRIVGFEVDIARWVAEAIFGRGMRQDPLKLQAIVTAQRGPFLKSGKVNLVADAYTVNCKRLKEVLFSQVYLLAHQRLLVRSDSTVLVLKDLEGRRVCATATGTAMATLSKPEYSAVVPVPVAARTDCLVALETGDVEGILTDDTFLYGFHKDDPATTILSPTYAEEPYALGIGLDHRDFVQFVNGVLESHCKSGELQRDYEHWFHSPMAPVSCEGSVPSPSAAP